jgi:diaminobutyrate-2-oxoglutarate transaminase
MRVFEDLESNVRYYGRVFPVVMREARGAEMWDVAGRRYLDFFAGAGALNYGHNPPALKERLIEYLRRDGITHSLDMATEAKEQFLEAFRRHILDPRQLSYKVHFCGPTGTNAVEAALKLVRKVSRRPLVLFFTNAFHGMTLGSLGVSGNGFKRAAAGVPLSHSMAVPFDGYLGPGVDTVDFLWRLLRDSSSGVDQPAAIIVETVQAEGGVNVGSACWLRRLAELCHEERLLLIVDDIQVGCGRTGTFFSFEEAGIEPDLVCLSKSLSGYGHPMSVVLIRPELDVWRPGEHNGTFRGYNPAFVTATAAIEEFWCSDALSLEVQRREQWVRARLCEIAASAGLGEERVRGRGLIQAIEVGPQVAARVTWEAFSRGLVAETAGAHDEVVKVLPPLTIADEQLEQGLDLLGQSIRAVLGRSPPRPQERPRVDLAMGSTSPGDGLRRRARQ